MAVQNSDAVRNALANSYETTIGASPTLEIRTGAQPANCAAAATGTVLATIALPADWLAAAAGGAVSKLGTWAVAATAAGTAAHYRINQGATCHEQGTITATGGGGDATITSTTIAVNDTVTVTAFNKTALNP